MKIKVLFSFTLYNERNGIFRPFCMKVMKKEILYFHPVGKCHFSFTLYENHIFICSLCIKMTFFVYSVWKWKKKKIFRSPCTRKWEEKEFFFGSPCIYTGWRNFLVFFLNMGFKTNSQYIFWVARGDSWILCLTLFTPGMDDFLKDWRENLSRGSVDVEFKKKKKKIK